MTREQQLFLDKTPAGRQDSVNLQGGSYCTLNLGQARLGNTVIKYCSKSDHPDKDIRLQREAAFIESLPAQSAALFPEILRQSTSAQGTRYEMAYIPYPTFAGVIQSGAYPAERLSGLLELVYDNLFAHLYRPLSSGISAATMPDYTQLATRRLDETERELPANHSLRLLLTAEHLLINGRQYPDVRRGIAAAEAFLRHVHLPATVNHGDLIFQDILINPDTSDFYLIDPNGESSGYMYDFAKTLLCLESHYDVFYEGAFNVRVAARGGRATSATIALHPVHYAETLATMRESFWRYLADNQQRFFPGMDNWRQTLLMLCGLQNIAIVMFHALHHRKERRAAAFLLNGIVLINRALREETS